MTPYASLQEAETYFATRLHSGKWSTFPPTERTAALVTATRHIDRLAYAGEKNASYVFRTNNPQACDSEINDAGAAQELQFPRGSDTVVPNDIKVACMEIAFDLIDGKSVELEFENVAVVSQGFSSVRKTKDSSIAQEHLLSGIVSVQAWFHLRPYLRDPNDFTLRRVS